MSAAESRYTATASEDCNKLRGCIVSYSNVGGAVTSFTCINVQ
jgi:hypothetical protein